MCLLEGLIFWVMFKRGFRVSHAKFNTMFSELKNLELYLVVTGSLF